MEKEPPSSSQSLDTSKALSNWTLIRRLLAVAWRYKWGCFRVLIIQFALLTMAITGLSIIGVGIDYIRYETAQQHPALQSQAGVETLQAAPVHIPKPPQWPFGIKPPAHWTYRETLWALAGGILVLAVLRAFLNYSNAVVTTSLIQGKIVVDLRARVYDKMQQLSFRFFDDNASGSLINRVTGDVQSVRLFIDGVVIQSITLLISLAIYISYMTSIHPLLTAACLASTPLLWVLTANFSRTVRPAYDKNRKLFDRLVLAISESIQGIHVIKGFARHQEEAARFATLNANFRDQQFWIFKKVSFFQPLIGFVAHLNIVVMLGYGGYLVVMYERAPDAATAILVGLSVGQLLVFTGLLQQFSNQVANITNLANSFQQSLTASQRVFEVLDAPVEIQSPPNAIRMPACKGKVQFDNVKFSYDPQDTPILADLKFTVEPGQVAAILGETASGKSTLLSLIPRFFDPTAGRVLVDDIDIRLFDVTDLRRKIGVVFQESFLFSNTVSANIAFGSPGADQKMIEDAARIACAHEFIMKMPQGYKTILHEGGINLSGGQRQRIAIARALLMNPTILLLDDPTSAIDPETEKEIMQAIENAMEGRTTFIVAHRLSTLRRADRVIVLKRGRIVQAGTHDELMKTVGQYSMAANLQIPDQESLNLLKDSPLP